MTTDYEKRLLIKTTKTMKTVTTIIMSLLFVAVFAPEVKAQQPCGDKVVTIEANMNCNSCKKTIETGLAKEKGVKAVVADLETKMVTVTYDESKVSETSLVKSIEEMGYKAKISDAKKGADKAPKKTGDGC